jgi:uncharacterized protein (DUF302 family)
MQYGFSKITDHGFEQAIEKVTEELKKEGFGVLSKIDFKETFKNKLNVDIDNYTVLGACNPGLAKSALNTEKEIGLFLPCNVLVYESNNKTMISIFDTDVITAVVDNNGIKPLAEEVKNKLKRALEAV